MIIARSPLRLTLGGGGTDLPSYYREHGGHLLAGSIDKYVYVTVHRTFADEMVLRYSSIERVKHTSEIAHPIIREALQILQLEGEPLEITTMADIASGTGLGSSGSFGTAILKALHRYRREVISQRELAEMACHIEIDRLQEPVGKQDQYTAAFGGVNCYEYRIDGTVVVTPLRLSEDTLTLFRRQVLLFGTGITRRAPDILREQQTKTLGHDQAMVDNLHYIKELGYRSKTALERADMTEFGRLLHQHWQHKKMRSKEMTNPFIEQCYQRAMDAGCLGGKLIGAGGGGFLMFCTEDPLALRATMKEIGLQELGYDFEFEGTSLLL
jgi:D-glycero-alpha-D-manno-heptose-7-phosphate kinase